MRIQNIGHLATHAHAASNSWTSAIPTAAAIVGIAAGAAAIGVPLYQLNAALLHRTILSRRDLAASISKLACGTTAEYTHSIFGPPAFRRSLGDSQEEHIHRTRHAWVQTIVNNIDQSVTAFAITVTDARFKFPIRDLTNF